MRVVVIGNAGGGKSTLASALATEFALPLNECDPILWKWNEGYERVGDKEFLAEHTRIIEEDRWVLEGLGLRSSFKARIERATHVVLIDLPLWQHYWLCAERQNQWERGELNHVPGTGRQMPPLKRLFQSIDFVEREWMPVLRDLVKSEGERSEKVVQTVRDFNELATFQLINDECT